MPRLPTMRVIGSHAISTMPLASFVFVGMALPPLALEAGHELVPRNSPLRFVVEGLGGDAAQPSDRGSVHTACHRRGGPARSQPSWTVAPNSHWGRSASSSGIIGA